MTFCVVRFNEAITPNPPTNLSVVYQRQLVLLVATPSSKSSLCLLTIRFITILILQRPYHPRPRRRTTRRRLSDNQCGMFNFLINLMVTE